MGCTQSKGVSPKSNNTTWPSNKSDGLDAAKQDDLQKCTRVTALPAACEAPGANPSDPCNVPKPSAQADIVELTPRGEGLLYATGPAPAAAAAAAVKPQVDPEFDYSQELSSVPAAKPVLAGGTATVSAGNLAALKPRPGALAPLGPTSTVAGLLSRQPDWLKETKAPLPPVATFSNLVASPAVDAEPHKSNSIDVQSSSSNDPPGPAATASHLPPLIKQGYPAATAKPGSADDSKISSLTALQSVELPHNIADGALGTNEVNSTALPAPRRLTGNLSKGKGERASSELPTVISQRVIMDAAAENTAGGVATSSAAALGQNRTSDASSSQELEYVGAVDQGDDGLHEADGEDSTAKQNIGRNSSSSSTASSSATAAQCSAAPAVTSFTATAAAYDPSDPWSVLQHQYAAAGGPPSPDHTVSGSGAYHSDFHAGQQQHRRTSGAALSQAAAAGSHYKGSVGTPSSVMANKRSDELVLVGSDDEDIEHHVDGSSIPCMGGATASNTPQVAEENSRAILGMAHKVGKPTAGSWGAGSMAAAGTIMLGDGSCLSAGPSQRTLGVLSNLNQGKTAAAAAAVHQHDTDDVFGGETPRDARLGAEYSSRTAGMAAGAVVGLEASGTSSQLQPDGLHAAGAAAEMELSVEDIDDVDAMIEAELAAKNALPGDLAAKLAQFEAMADDDIDE